ncbi:MAG TPA: SMI1/KNR4 family protein [Chloroflexia bacterium]|nr:SMI1/KNR4 family protein [Chloroflexia bacterium]
MNQIQLDRIHALLKASNIAVTSGLTDKEITAAESQYGFRFPPDLRALLQAFLPLAARFPDWRHADPAALHHWLQGPEDGICFDIEHAGFWWPEWGPRPGELAQALAVARRALGTVPGLIPVFAHRYLPDEPNLEGNPVFSVHQTDIIYYGHDLVSYFENEFARATGAPLPVPVDNRRLRRIRFWSALVE